MVTLELPREVSRCSVCCLSPMASVALPRAEQDIRAALNVLALNFDLKDKVVEEPLKVGVRNLEEFWFLCEDEAQVGTFVGKLAWAMRSMGSHSCLFLSRGASLLQNFPDRFGLPLGRVGASSCQAGVLAALPP